MIIYSVDDRWKGVEPWWNDTDRGTQGLSHKIVSLFATLSIVNPKWTVLLSKPAPHHSEKSVITAGPKVRDIS